MRFLHVYPVKDIKEHVLNGHMCECMPRVDFKSHIVIHNSWDLREYAWQFTEEVRMQDAISEFCAACSEDDGINAKDCIFKECPLHKWRI